MGSFPGCYWSVDFLIERIIQEATRNVLLIRFVGISCCLKRQQCRAHGGSHNPTDQIGGSTTSPSALDVFGKWRFFYTAIN